MQKTNDKTDSIIAVVLALLVYIPGSSIGNILRLGVVVVVFVMKHMNEHAEPGIRKVALFMVLSPLLSVLFVVIIEGFGVNWDLVIHEIQRMLFCAFLLMTVAKLHISFRMIYIIAIIVLLPNFMIQLLQRANVNAVFTFIKKYYQSGVADDQWTHLDLAKEQGGGFRSGSIFINPNVYMAIPLMALVVFLQQDKEKSSIWNYVLIGCAVFSAFLTGSRTALIVIAVMMVWYIVKYAGTGSKIFMELLFFPIDRRKLWKPVLLMRKLIHLDGFGIQRGKFLFIGLPEQLALKLLLWYLMERLVIFMVGLVCLDYIGIYCIIGQLGNVIGISNFIHCL